MLNVITCMSYPECRCALMLGVVITDPECRYDGHYLNVFFTAGFESNQIILVPILKKPFFSFTDYSIKKARLFASGTFSV